MRTNILLVDNHPLILIGIRYQLTSFPEFNIVGEGISREEVLQKVNELDVDLVIIGLNLPGVNIIDLIKTIKCIHPRIKIVILSACRDRSTIIGLFTAGIDGYVLKDEEAGNLVDAIHAVQNGKDWLSPSIASLILGRFKNARTNPGSNQLTEKEQQLIHFFAEGLTTIEISSHMNLSVRAVEMRITNLYKKIGLRSRASVVYWAKENGIL